MYVFDLSFIARAIYRPSIMLEHKDSALNKLKEASFDNHWLDLLATDLLEICEAMEKKLTSPVS